MAADDVHTGSSHRRWRWAFFGGLLVVIVLASIVGVRLFDLYQAADAIPTVEFDPAETRQELAEEPIESVEETDIEVTDVPDTIAVPEPVEDEVFEAYLIIGSDARADFDIARADVILVALLPPGDVSPILFSLPRDLYLTTPCAESLRRINAALLGCGDSTGPEVLAVIVEDFTGIPIDHFALIDFDGFEDVIDAFGGVEICVDHAIRDPKIEIAPILPGGCTLASGEQALGWVRSRRTQELVDGSWQTVQGVSDLTRNARQQELLFSLLARVREVGGLGSLVTLAESLQGAVLVDSGLSVVRGADLVWDLRSLTADDVTQLEVPVRFHRTESGAEVLIPDGSFSDVLSGVLATDLSPAAAG